jgi:hypothetical protein
MGEPESGCRCRDHLEVQQGSAKCPDVDEDARRISGQIHAGDDAAADRRAAKYGYIKSRFPVSDIIANP